MRKVAGVAKALAAFRFCEMYHYHNALGALSAYLLSLEPTKLVTEEVARTLKLQDLLDQEIKLIL